MGRLTETTYKDWLRRRLRMCYVKRWRWSRKKVRELVKLGTNLRVAISLGLSRKGPWRLSRTQVIQTGMTNKWEKDQSLLSVNKTVGKHSLPGYGSVASGNRLVRTRLIGDVGAGEERPPATRLGSLCLLVKSQRMNPRPLFFIFCQMCRRDPFVY